MLRQLLYALTREAWRIGRLVGRGTVVDRGVDVVSVRMELVGRAGADHVIASLDAEEGVRDVAVVTEDELG